jgi:apolipoprotein N-acyltransferase
MIAVLCAALSGAMFYFSQGLDDIWWLAWIAPLPLLWLAYGEEPAWRLAAAGLAAFCAGQIYVIQCYGDLPVAVIAPIVAGLSALFVVALLFARAAYRRLLAFAALFAFPAVWTAIEYAVGLVSPHGSFGSLAYAEVSFPPAIQVASLFGVHAITFTLCLFATALAMLARRRWAQGAAGVAVCAVALGIGFARLAEPQGETVRVAALADPDARHKANSDHSPASSTAAAEGYAAAIREHAARGVRVFAIPEGAIPMEREWENRVLAPLAAAAKDTGVLIVAGTYGDEPPLNRAFAFWPSGALAYSKRHPLLPFEKEVPGTSPGLLPGGRAMAICKDLDFPRTIRADAEHGLRLMIVPASDFGRDDWIHARMAILRGVENGFAMLRSAFHGLETASDAQGRVLAQANTSRPGMTGMVADLPLGPGPTLYTRIGDVFAWLCAAAAVVLAAAFAAGRSRRPV